MPWCNFWARCVFRSVMKFLRPSVCLAPWWRALASSGCQVLVRCQLVRVGLSLLQICPACLPCGHRAPESGMLSTALQSLLNQLPHLYKPRLHTHPPLPTSLTGLASVWTLIDTEFGTESGSGKIIFEKKKTSTLTVYKLTCAELLLHYLTWKSTAHPGIVVLRNIQSLAVPDESFFVASWMSFGYLFLGFFLQLSFSPLGF